MKKNIYDYISNRNIKLSQVVLYIILICEIASLFYLNFKHMYQMIDFDSSGAFFHSIEVWRQKTLFLKEYQYATTADLDSIVGIVALLFGITHNIMFSQAIGNSLVIILYLYLINRLFNATGIRKEVRIACEILLIIPYTWEQLGYVSMLFTNSACNSIRYVMPILLSSVVISMNAKEPFGRYIGRLFLLCIVAFFVGLSSGLYVLLCGIFPFILAEFIHMLFAGKWECLKNRRMIVIVITTIICMVGYLLEGPLGFTNKANTMALMDANSFIDGISISFIGIYQLFGGIAATEGIAFNSIEGIRILLNWMVATVAIISVVYNIIKLIKKKANMPMYLVYALCVFGVNELALLLLKTSYGGGLSEFRYHIMSAFAMFILIAGFVNDIICGDNIPFKQFTIVMLIIVIGACSASNTYLYYQSLRKTDTRIYTKLQEACKKYNISSLMFLFAGDSNLSTGRVARAYLEDVNCIITHDNWTNVSPTTWGGSTAGLDNKAVGDRLYIVSNDELIQQLPSYVYGTISVCEDYGETKLYEASKNGLDLESGYSNRRDTIDFPYSPGYGYDTNFGAVDDEGRFVSNGNGAVALQGPVQNDLSGKWNVTVHYKVISSVDDEDANISIMCNSGQDIVKMKVLNKNDTVCTLKNVEINTDMKDVQNSIYVPEGMVIDIQDIQMELVH